MVFSSIACGCKRSPLIHGWVEPLRLSDTGALNPVAGCAASYQYMARWQ